MFLRNTFVKKEQVLTIFFDLEKAYYTTWKHSILADLWDLGQAWALSAKMQIYAALKLTFHREKKQGTLILVCTDTQETYKACSHAAIACCSHLIVNTATAVTLMGRR